MLYNLDLEEKKVYEIETDLNELNMKLNICNCVFQDCVDAINLNNFSLVVTG